MHITNWLIQSATAFSYEFHYPKVPSNLRLRCVLDFNGFPISLFWVLKRVHPHDVTSSYILGKQMLSRFVAYKFCPYAKGRPGFFKKK